MSSNMSSPGIRVRRKFTQPSEISKEEGNLTNFTDKQLVDND